MLLQTPHIGSPARAANYKLKFVSLSDSGSGRAHGNAATTFGCLSFIAGGPVPHIIISAKCSLSCNGFCISAGRKFGWTTVVSMREKANANKRLKMLYLFASIELCLICLISMNTVECRLQPKQFVDKFDSNSIDTNLITFIACIIAWMTRRPTVNSDPEGQKPHHRYRRRSSDCRAPFACMNIGPLRGLIFVSFHLAVQHERGPRKPKLHTTMHPSSSHQAHLQMSLVTSVSAYAAQHTGHHTSFHHGPPIHHPQPLPFTPLVHSGHHHHPHPHHHHSHILPPPPRLDHKLSAFDLPNSDFYKNSALIHASHVAAPIPILSSAVVHPTAALPPPLVSHTHLGQHHTFRHSSPSPSHTIKSNASTIEPSHDSVDSPPLIVDNVASPISVSSSSNNICTSNSNINNNNSSSTNNNINNNNNNSATTTNSSERLNGTSSAQSTNGLLDILMNPDKCQEFIHYHNSMLFPPLPMPGSTMEIRLPTWEVLQETTARLLFMAVRWVRCLMPFQTLSKNDQQLLLQVRNLILIFSNFSHNYLLLLLLLLGFYLFVNSLALDFQFKLWNFLSGLSPDEKNCYIMFSIIQFFERRNHGKNCFFWTWHNGVCRGIWAHYSTAPRFVNAFRTIR